MCLILLTALSLGGVVPRSFPKLQREALVTLVKASAVFAAATSVSGAGAATTPRSCTCKSKDKGCTCVEEAGALALREQMDQISNGKSFYDPRNERIYNTQKKSFIPAHPEDYLEKELGNRNVVVIGEVHSNRCHHHAEFEMVRALHRRGGEFPRPGMAIGLECFYRQHQTALDNFVFLHGDMGTLKRETNWQNTWGYDLNYYSKIFQFAALNKIRLIGLNVPYQVVQLVSSSGFDDLPPSLKRLLPPLVLDNDKHRQQFVDAISGSLGHAADPGNMQRMYEAQTLWDEYMAESASSFVQKNPGQVLLVIAGIGHVQGRVGIPDRIAKRTGRAPFVVLPQQVDWTEGGLPNIREPLGIEAADWIWYTEAY